jgi:hypothetical protein
MGSVLQAVLRALQDFLVRLPRGMILSAVAAKGTLTLPRSAFGQLWGGTGVFLELHDCHFVFELRQAVLPVRV